MIRSLVRTATFLFLASGCGASATGTWVSPDELWTEPSTAVRKKSAEKKPEKAAEVPIASAPVPQVGDFTVQRYSGSFRKNPVTVTEEVIAREGDLMIVDHTLEEAGQTERLRTRVDLKSRRIVAASKLENGSEQELSVAAYETLMSGLTFAADSNEELLGAEAATCLVGEQEHECQVTSYRVTIGGKPGKLSISTSKTLADRDVAGEIRSEDGSVIYRAEIVEVGSRKPTSSVASVE